jgi:hypothetical protein
MGVEKGEFRVTDVDVVARRLLIQIDGLGAQKVIRDVSTDEIKHIAWTLVSSELGLVGYQPSVSTRSSVST